MRTVFPEDCVGQSEPPAVVIILDVPAIEMIPSVVRSFDTAYKPFRSIDPSDVEKHTVRVIYHLLGEGVIQDERYIDFMKGFPEATEVILFMSINQPAVLTPSIYSMSYRLPNTAQTLSHSQATASNNIAFLN
jgi:ribonuclease Z